MKTTNEYYDRLIEIQKNYPELTFNNKGYECLNKDIQERNKEIIEEVSEICKKTIDGFRVFNNFKTRKDKTFSVRVQYDYDSSFVGVGYFNINEFKNFEL